MGSAQVLFISNSLFKGTMMTTNATPLQVNDIHQETVRYQAVLERDPQITDRTIPVHLTLGKLYERAGENASAVQEFAKVALYYADHGQIVKAIAAAQMIVRIEPENDDILERLRELYFMRRAVSEDQLADYHESLTTLDALQPEREAFLDAALREAQEDAPDVIRLLKKVPLLEKLSVSELRGLYEHSELRAFAPNEAVLTRGNARRSLFVILRGRVKIFGKDKEHRPVYLATLETGNSFGEFALFGKVDPNLSVTADHSSALLEIPRELVLKLAKTRPAITQFLKELFKQRILDTALASVPLFSQLHPQDRKQIVARFTPFKAKEGTVIVREGESGDCMYFITSGSVGVYTLLLDADEQAAAGGGNQDEPLLLATLKSGDFFGEQAIVSEEPRSATVIAQTNVMMLRLTKYDLDAVLQEFPAIESALQIEAFEHRLKKNITLLNELMPSAVLGAVIAPSMR